MKKSFVIHSLSVLLAAVVLTVSVFAEDIGIFSEDTISGERDSSVFVAGNDVTSDAIVNGALFAAGNKLRLSGSSSYTMAAGNDLHLTGDTENDVFLAGNSIIIDGPVERDIFACARAITISGEVGRNIFAAADTIQINGNVGGELFLDANQITIGENAVIVGRLHCKSTTSLNAPQSVLDRVVISQVELPTPEEAPSKTRVIAEQICEKLLSFLGMTVLAFALLWLTPLWETVDAKYRNASFAKYAAAFGIGFAVLSALPIAAIVLMLLRVGARLAPILLLLYAAAIIASPIFLGFFLGALVWRRVFKKNTCYWAELPIGILLYRAVTSIPYVGFLAGLIAVPLGVGIIALLLGKKPAAISPLEENGTVNG